MGFIYMLVTCTGEYDDYRETVVCATTNYDVAMSYMAAIINRVANFNERSSNPDLEAVVEDLVDFYRDSMMLRIDRVNDSMFTARPESIHYESVTRPESYWKQRITDGEPLTEFEYWTDGIEAEFDKKV